MEINLWEFEARQSDDDVKRDLELIHTVCGTHVCDIEPDDVLAVLVSVAEDHARECDGLPHLEWSTSDSADTENHDQEVDLDAIGSPGGASWASVSPSWENQWWWVIYDRWIDVDDEPDPTLAEGHLATEAEAKAAVATWVRDHQDGADGPADENDEH
jgi:hypothetical protein